MKITSTAFDEGAMIPGKYTCDDKDISPPLKWSDAPEGTKTFALICDDPDAPGRTWVHWVLFNLLLVIRLFVRHGRCPVMLPRCRGGGLGDGLCVGSATGGAALVLVATVVGDRGPRRVGRGSVGGSIVIRDIDF